MASENKIPAPRILTPLWVIFSFVGLTETVLGVGVIATNGGVQIALTAFVIVFPLLIAGAFFAILWNRSYVFYPPHEYGPQVNVVEYVEAMQRKPLNQEQLLPAIDNTIRSTFQSKELVAELVKAVSQSPQNSASAKVATVLKAQADKAVETIKEEGFLTIDLRPLLGENGKEWQVPYEKFSSIRAVLFEIVAALGEGSYKSLDYGEAWLVQEADSGKILGRESGWTFDVWDSRSLQEAGINPGARLEAFSFTKTIERKSEFSGQGAGTYSHGLGVVPDKIYIRANKRLVDHSLGNITSTSVHVHINSSVAFTGRAIKYAPIPPPSERIKRSDKQAIPSDTSKTDVE